MTPAAPELPAAAAQRVYVVEDDEAMRDAIGMLLRTAGYEVRAYASAAAFLADQIPESGCLLLDVRMPGMSGLELQDRLVARGSALPIIFVSAHGDIPMAVDAVRRGAIDFLEKPFARDVLLGRVRRALQEQAARELAGADRRQRAERIARLTPRERTVLERILEGKPNRVVAEELDVAVKTVEFHRARIMAKLGVRSAAALFRYCLETPAALRKG